MVATADISVTSHIYVASTHKEVVVKAAEHVIADAGFYTLMGILGKSIKNPKPKP